VPALPPISQFQEPVLRALHELGGEGSNADIAARVADLMGLDAEQRAIPHGQDGRSEMEYRVAWARTRLSKTGKIERCGRGTWRLAQSARDDARE
jgi:restriction system protein